MSAASNRRRLGIALDGKHLAITWREGDGRAWRSITAPCDGSPDSIAHALAELIAKAPAVRDVSVTLARPIAHLRALRLPRMARATLEGVLARDWSRHVVGHRNSPHTVSARATDPGTWIASFAPTDVLEVLADTAAAQGWEAVEISASDDVLASAARELVPQETRSGDCFVVLCDVAGPKDVVLLRGGVPWRGRRLLPGATEADIAAFVHAADGAAGATVALLGHPTRTSSPAKALGTQGMRARAVDLGLVPEASDAEMLAAAATLARATLPLRSPGVQRTQAHRMRSVTRGLAVAAAAALLFGVGLDRWRVQRALAAVQQARADLAAPVRDAMSVRSGVESAAEVAAALAERETNASRVNGVLAAVAVALPSGTTLTAMHVAGDSVTVEGESARSALVYDALRAVPVFEQVKLAAPLRQERQAGDVAVEHFAFSARLRAR